MAAPLCFHQSLNAAGRLVRVQSTRLPLAFLHEEAVRFSSIDRQGTDREKHGCIHWPLRSAPLPDRPYQFDLLTASFSTMVLAPLWVFHQAISAFDFAKKYDLPIVPIICEGN